MDEIFFAEATFRIIRERRENILDILQYNNVKDMEHYKFLMGRLEGYKFVEMAISDLLKKNSNS